MKRLYKGILFILLAAFSFSLMSTFIRLAGDIPAVQKSLFRNLVAAVFSFLIMKRRGEKFEIKEGNMKFLLWRSAVGTLGIFLNFYAVGNLLLANANMLNKLSPFFAVIFSFFLLKEKISPTQMIALIVAFIGSLFIIKPSFANAELIPGLAGLMGGIFAGFAYTMVRKLGSRGQSGISIVFFFSAFSTVASLLVSIFVFEPMSTRQVIYLLLAGLSALGGQLGITHAYIYAPAKEISIYDYAQIIFATVLGFFIFGQVPDIYSFIGYIIIIAMAFLMFHYSKKKSKENIEARE